MARSSGSRQAVPVCRTASLTCSARRCRGYRAWWSVSPCVPGAAVFELLPPPMTSSPSPTARPWVAPRSSSPRWSPARRRGARRADEAEQGLIARRRSRRRWLAAAERVSTEVCSADRPANRQGLRPPSATWSWAWSSGDDRDLVLPSPADGQRAGMLLVNQTATVVEALRDLVAPLLEALIGRGCQARALTQAWTRPRRSPEHVEPDETPRRSPTTFASATATTTAAG